MDEFRQEEAQHIVRGVDARRKGSVCYDGRGLLPQPSPAADGSEAFRLVSEVA